MLVKNYSGYGDNFLTAGTAKGLIIDAIMSAALGFSMMFLPLSKSAKKHKQYAAGVGVAAFVLKRKYRPGQ